MRMCILTSGVCVLNPVHGRLPHHGADPDADVGCHQVHEGKARHLSEPLNQHLGGGLCWDYCHL